MASSLLTLLDDVASLLDDVAAMTGVAARKTAGVLGDDLALNAQQVAGIDPDRELPVVWAVAKGSLLNKAILVPAALLLSWAAPWAVLPLMIAGGAFLCFEGVEKLAHRFLHGGDEEARHHAELVRAVSDTSVDMLEFERDKIRGAIRTDFILSAEIIVITLGLVAHAPFAQRVAVLAGIALIMTVGVYGLVAGIVKLDDAGLYLSRLDGAAGALRTLGRGILRAAPWLMKFLSAAGTAAMFLVGGGILTHGVPWLHGLVAAVAPGDGWAALLTSTVVDLGVGIAVGLLVLGVVATWRKARSRASAAP